MRGAAWSGLQGKANRQPGLAVERSESTYLVSRDFSTLYNIHNVRKLFLPFTTPTILRPWIVLSIPILVDNHDPIPRKARP